MAGRGAVRLQRGALLRRQHRPDRRLRLQRAIGAAWVFTRSGSTWTQQGPKLTGSGEVGAGEFGESVALSSNGNTALIGGDRDNGGRRRGVGLHALGLDLDPAGRKAPRKRRRRGRRGRIRRERRAVRRRHAHVRADRRPRGRPRRHRRGTARRGCSRARARPGPSRVKSSAAGASGRSGGPEEGEFGDSVALLGGNTALIGGPGDNQNVGACVGVHALGHDLDPAGRKDHGQRGDRAGEFGRRASALSASGNTALIGAPATTTTSARRGCSRARARPGRSRAKS